MKKKKNLTTCDPHNHKCECGLVWHHDPALVTPDPGDSEETNRKLNEIYNAAHLCTNCGAEVRMIDLTDAKPTVLFTGRGAPEPIAGEPIYNDDDKMKAKRSGMKFRLMLNSLLG